MLCSWNKLYADLATKKIVELFVLCAVAMASDAGFTGTMLTDESSYRQSGEYCMY